MKTTLKHLSKILLLSVLLMFIWIVSMGFTRTLFPAEIKSTGYSPLFFDGHAVHCMFH